MIVGVFVAILVGLKILASLVGERPKGNQSLQQSKQAAKEPEFFKRQEPPKRTPVPNEKPARVKIFVQNPSRSVAIYRPVQTEIINRLEAFDWTVTFSDNDADFVVGYDVEPYTAAEYRDWIVNFTVIDTKKRLAGKMPFFKHGRATVTTAGKEVAGTVLESIWDRNK